ncbi:MAG: hypothetical protein D6729_06700 [Deltaproteobacteria bacterium]|nr:MAG: hypothetical protein D6729_06700 [Deltaproteobacteria bacterium]
MRFWGFYLVSMSCAATTGAAIAQVRHVGNVAVIEDLTGAIHDQSGFWTPDRTCRETARVFFGCHDDEYDVLVTFTTKPLDAIHNVAQGTPVRQDVQGIGFTQWDNSADYGSAGALQHCVFMGDLAQLPDPDGPVKVLFGVPLGITGIELLGHEFGHHWLLFAEYDLGDGRGPQHEWRQWDDSGGPNGHYAGSVDSHSVMYGNFITDNGDGTFTRCGGDRKYNHFDQYFMGLRAPAEVDPIFLVSDGTGMGDPSGAEAKGACSTISGTRVDITVDDVIRALGPRVPDASSAQHHWTAAFVLVHEAGNPPSAEDIQKVEAYRSRFEPWFTWATDGRGSVETRLGPLTCTGLPPTDGGMPDAQGQDGGQPDAGGPADAGGPPSGDGGIPPPSDAGAEDAGAVDGPSGSDGGTLCELIACDGGAAADAGGGTGYETLPSEGGCACDAGRSSAASALLLTLGVLLRRRRR